jgi:hypothetical protein
MHDPPYIIIANMYIALCTIYPQYAVADRNKYKFQITVKGLCDYNILVKPSYQYHIRSIQCPTVCNISLS